MKKKYVNPAVGNYVWLRKLFVIMRLTFFLTLVSAMLVSASGLSQVTQLSLEYKKISVAQLLQQIENQTDYRFAYSNSSLNPDELVSIDVKDGTLDQVLKEILDSDRLSYKIIDRYVVISDSNVSVQNSKQQIHTVSGKVTDSSGSPLPGVTVLIKGTTQGIITDVNGNYILPNVPADATLVFSFVGMKTVELAVSGKSVINTILEEEAIGIEEVVAVGYGRQKKANLTGAVATVRNEELVQVPVASTSQALAGRLPGLISKQSEGKPGTTPTISIRGFGTPLIIVDGIEQRNYYNIDPNEIESFSILKDASAAVYGARAGNGVILITTRRGKSGKPKISFNNSVSAQTPTIYPKFADSWEYAIIQNEANAFAGKSPVYTDEEIQKFRDGTDPDYPNVDHYSEVIKKWSLMETNNINIQGGSDNVNYFFSVGYLFQDGIYNSNGVDMNRYNIRSNIDINVLKNLSVGLDLSTSNSINHDVPTTSQDIFQTIGTTTNKYPATYPDPTKIPNVGRSSHNALIKINPDLFGYNNTNRKYLTGALTFKYEVPFVKGLNVKIRGNYVGDDSYNKKWTKPYLTYNYDRVNDIYTIAATGGKYSLTEQQDRAQELTFQGFLEYENTFAGHDVQALLVSEIIDTKFNWFNAYKDGFISGAVDQMFAGSNANMSTDGSAFEESRMSYVGRLNYGYKSKYLAEGTVRYDGSSRFDKDFRWAFFPSISLAWRISEEKFIKNNAPFINNLKLRVSYSHTGYDRNATAYQYLSTYSFNTQYVFGTIPYKTIKNNGIENPMISWEDIYTYNSGLDIDLWNGLFGAEFDLFYRLRDGILGTRTAVLPNTFGATLPQENINSIDDRGFELVLKHRNAINEFKYSLNANISWSRAKYVKYAELEYDDPDLERINKKTGNWVNRSFGYKTDGLFQTQDEITNSSIDYDLKGNRTIKSGMIKYVDVNDDKKIDWRDNVELGKGSIPDLMFGLNINCEYKGFDLSMLWQGATDFNIEFAQNMRNLTINNVWNSYKFLYDGRWTPENPNAEFPGTTNGTNKYNNVTSDMWLKPGDYIRLKNFSFGYSLPKTIVGKLRFDKVRVYFAGYNVLTIDKLGKFPFDPEGIGTSWTYPLYKSFSFGLNIVL